MKKIVYFLKCIVSGIISLILLSMFAMVYYNPPVADVQPDFITNNRFVSNSRWSYMLEGVGGGKIDNLGYNNAYYNDLSVPDIVFVGSSHVEALQVPQDSNFVYLLNQKFNEDGLANNNFKCLNLGISGHFFNISASNFEYIINKFKDAKYVVIETLDVKFSPSELDGIMEGKFHLPLSERGFFYKAVQKVPYFRLLFKKFNDMKAVDNKNNVNANDGISKLEDKHDIDVYTKKMGAVLEKLSTLSKQNGVDLIIMMHERFGIVEGGKVVMEKEQEYKNAFKKCCNQYGIKVIDAVPDMIEHYEKHLELSYGFCNTTPGNGHLNKVGHQVIADVLYDQICEMEENR